MTARLVVAAREVVAEHAGALAALDRSLCAELGEAYSEERWGEAEFLAERPAKFELSMLALSGTAPAGFWIASLADAGRCHAHRVGVERAARGHGVGRELCEAVAARARDRGATAMTLHVAAANRAARSAYARLGFDEVPNAERLTLLRPL